MHLPDDAELLSAYATRGAEEAFATLVERHVSLVYSCALRQAGDAQLAQEITQAVFITLARKAGRLGQETILQGWLCRAAHFTARNALKAEHRRHHHEQEAYMESLLQESQYEAWPQMAPLLDEAVAQLGDADRNAVVLRYYEQQPLEEVGRALGLNADTAQKRVSRALEKLRKFFRKRGVMLTTTIIAGSMAAKSVQAAPAGLAKAVTAAALAKGAAASGSTITLIKGALKFMAWSKTKTAVVAGAAALLLLGTATLFMSRSGKPWTVNCQPNFVLEVGGVEYPGGVAEDAAGNVYVSDTRNNRIKKFTKSGAEVKQWGGDGHDAGLLNYPQGLATDGSKYLYVADVNNQRVQKFTLDGAFVAQWGEPGTGPGQFNRPYNVALDQAGNVYVVDNGNGRVQKFTGEGVYVSEFGGAGTEGGQLQHPQGVAVDDSGNVYVGDGGNGRIAKFSADGTYVAGWRSSSHDVAVDARGHVFVVGHDCIEVFQNKGTLLTQWGSTGKGPGQFDFAARVAVNPAGTRVFVTDAQNNRVEIFSR